MRLSFNHLNIKWLSAALNLIKLIVINSLLATKALPATEQMRLENNSIAHLELNDSEFTNHQEKSVYFWGHAANWSIFVDKGMGPACYIAGSFSGGSRLLLGLNKNGKHNSYLMFRNEAWPPLEEGGVHDFELTFDDETAWIISAEVVEVDNRKMLAVTFTNEILWSEFIQSNKMRIRYESEAIMRLAIDNSRLAVEKLVQCQMQLRDSRK